MTEAIRLVNPHSYAKAEEIIAKAPCNGKWVVEVREKRLKRSHEQNKLMRIWDKEWSVFYNEHMGGGNISPDDAHASFKMKFVLPKIIINDPESGLYIQKLINQTTTIEARLAFAGLAIDSDKISTAQYAEAMQEWEEDKREQSEKATENRFVFIPSHPEDLYYEAMGKK